MRNPSSSSVLVVLRRLLPVGARSLVSRVSALSMLALVVAPWSTSGLRAEDNAPGQVAAVPAQELACRVFTINPNDGQGGFFLTSDRTGPIGAWLGPMIDSGWRVSLLDYEVAQKSTGFPEPTVMVCVSRSVTGR